jgi:hypothetical protein
MNVDNASANTSLNIEPAPMDGVITGDVSSHATTTY